MKNSCVVLMPTHKSRLNKRELEAFLNNLLVLKGRHCVVILPEGVSQQNFLHLRKKLKLDFEVINLKSGYLGSIEKYNQMALAPDFYQMFIDHEYVLICQFDVWLLRDNLDDWLDLDYDYIGAPLFLPWDNPRHSFSQLISPAGGNGGLSLRRTKMHLELLSRPTLRPNLQLFLRCLRFLVIYRNRYFTKVFFRSCYQLFKNPMDFRNRYEVYEDVMLSIGFALYDRKFKVAPPHIAMSFSIEVHSQVFLESKLKFTNPFGIHGYDKYLDKDFFQRLIQNKSRNAVSYEESV